MSSKWHDVFVRVSTPHGVVNVGWMLEQKNRCSKIMCLVWMEQKELHMSKTLLLFAGT